MSDKWVTSATLQRLNSLDIVRSTIGQLVESIDDNILAANDAGGDYIEYDLNPRQNIGQLSLVDSQLLIWSELVGTYMKPIEDGGKGFRANLIKDGTRVLLRIEWDALLPQEERKERLALIEQVTIVRGAKKGTASVRENMRENARANAGEPLETARERRGEYAGARDPTLAPREHDRADVYSRLKDAVGP